MQPNNMIMIHYWEKRNGGHLEHVLNKMDHLSWKHQINVFFMFLYQLPVHAIFFLVYCLSNKLLSY